MPKVCKKLKVIATTNHVEISLDVYLCNSPPKRWSQSYKINLYGVVLL